MTSVLVVEDDMSLRRALRVTLHSRSYEVIEAGSGEEALILSRDRSPDLVLLDLNLPGIDGIDALRHLRAESEVPIVVLTVRNARSTKVAALDAGADDYVIKPFDSEELLARIRAALRRRPEPAPATPPVLRIGDLEIDVSRRKVQRAGNSIRLTRTELRLLELLISSDGRLLTHEQMQQAIWGSVEQSRATTLRVFVGQLRNKLGDDAADPHLIVNETGLGYRWIAEPA
jgi:two-component system, OmpR family, KDP operon response regulator KdpE